MATIYPRQNKDGTITWRMMIRRKGYPILCRAFSSEKDAKEFAEANEEIYCTDPDSFNLSIKEELIARRKRQFKQKRPGISS